MTDVLVTTIKHGYQDNFNAAILSPAAVCQGIKASIILKESATSNQPLGMLTATAPLSCRYFVHRPFNRDNPPRGSKHCSLGVRPPSTKTQRTI